VEMDDDAVHWSYVCGEDAQHLELVGLEEVTAAAFGEENHGNPNQNYTMSYCGSAYVASQMLKNAISAIYPLHDTYQLLVQWL